jgi:hypothetical protein
MTSFLRDPGCFCNPDHNAVILQNDEIFPIKVTAPADLPGKSFIALGIPAQLCFRTRRQGIPECDSPSGG